MPIKGAEGADEEKIRCACGARPCLGGHAPTLELGKPWLYQWVAMQVMVKW